MNKVLCFGELLLRLSPQLGQEWIRGASMSVYVGGAELNVANALALWGTPVSFATALPDNYLSQEILDNLESKNINTTSVVRSTGRMGLYYLPQGADLKNAGVIYDRAHSSFAGLRPGQIDWDEVLRGVNWFHFSAISPAVSASAADVCREALRAAVCKGLTISVDLNYRDKLWQWGKHPLEVMPELVRHCDVVMGNIWAAEKMLGISLPQEGLNTKEELVAQAEKTSLELIKRFPKCKQVANTFRFDAGGELNYYATLYRHNHLYVSQEHQTAEVVDKVGSGDCFMAGLLYGNLQRFSSQELIDFAAAAAFSKLSIKGDATTATVEDIKQKYRQHA